MQEVDFVFSILILLMSVVVHEVSHGFMAYLLGDSTAKYERRLTLNPIHHLEFMGSFVVPVLFYMSAGIIFGWAKPVPYNPYNIKRVNPKTGGGLIGLAGPISNFLIAGIFSLIVHYGADLSFMTASFINIATLIIMVNVSLGTFNLIPIPPLDGSKILFAILPKSMEHLEHVLERFGFILLIAFIVFFGGFITPIITKVLQFFL